MERNLKAVERKGKWFVEYEYFSYYFDEWRKSIFKDLNGEDLQFHSEEGAKNFVKTRNKIMQTI